MELRLDGAFRFQIVEVSQEQHPRGLLGVIELGRATGFFSENVVKISEDVFKHEKDYSKLFPLRILDSLNVRHSHVIRKLSGGCLETILRSDGGKEKGQEIDPALYEVAPKSITDRLGKISRGRLSNGTVARGRAI